MEKGNAKWALNLKESCKTCPVRIYLSRILIWKNCFCYLCLLSGNWPHFVHDYRTCSELNRAKLRQACCCDWIGHYAEFMKAFPDRIIKINQLEKNKDPVPWHGSIKNVAFHYEIAFVPGGKFWIYMDVYVYVYMGDLREEKRQLDTQASYSFIHTRGPSERGHV